MRTEKQLIELYADIAYHLEHFNYDDVMPSFAIYRHGICFTAYVGKNALDPYEMLVEFELKCGKTLSLEDLMVFNVLDCGFWKGYSIDESVFAIDDHVMPITDDIFLACCMTMRESDMLNNVPYFSRGKAGSFIMQYVLSILEKIDKTKPMFFLELFISDPSKFTYMVENSGSKKLQEFILKMFTRNAALHIDPNVRKAYRKATSQFKEEMAKHIVHSNGLK